jgi:hypothetical protein
MKATRLDKYCQGWRGQKYVRKLTNKTRRRMEKAMLDSPDYERDVPAIPAKGWSS